LAALWLFVSLLVLHFTPELKHSDANKVSNQRAKSAAKAESVVTKKKV